MVLLTNFWLNSPMAKAKLSLLILSTAALLSLALATPVLAADPHGVEFPSLHRDKTVLKGFLVKPDGDGPFAAVALFHGCGGPLTSKGAIAARERAWMNVFVEEGYVVLLVDSFNPRGFAGICTTRVRPITAEEDRPYDAYAALGWLRQQPFVKADKIAMMGWSHGAMTTLSTISDATIKDVGWQQPGYVTGVTFYPGCLDLSKTRYRTQVPLLMQLGEKDDWTPARYCLKLADMAKQGGGTIEVDTYAGAYHAFDNPGGSVRTRSTSNKTGTRTVHVGRDPEAAERSMARVKAWMATFLKE